MVTVIPRSEWGAQHERGAGPAPLPAKFVYLHHSVTIAPDLVPPFDDEHRAMRTLENIGEQRFGRGISYTFGIVPTGNVYEGHGVETLGAHTARLNSSARAICFVGNYEANEPTPQMLESAAQLLVHGKRHGWWLDARFTGGHRDSPYSSTACPGRFAYEAIPTINARANQLLKGTDDVPLNDADKDFIRRELRPIFDTLTPGIERVKHDGQLYAWVRDTNARTAGLETAVRALAAARDDDLDVEALLARVDATVREAMTSTVQVEVSVTDPT